ncbi:MAG TPA: archaellum operon transcriptional activator EarA family protein [Candidatus Thermoplasmatota archaeon]|nr:archaellum operon transcriptional activator EarA family protein [Candidatus Thermoplasmatota archaeon]
MEPIASEFERSLRRSRVRTRLLLSLSSLGEAYVGQLARHAGTTWPRARAALFGGPGYRPALSLVGLGLASVEPSAFGRRIRITPRGRRKARSVASSRRF